jgi:hypothetical protein
VKGCAYDHEPSRFILAGLNVKIGPPEKCRIQSANGISPSIPRPHVLMFVAQCDVRLSGPALAVVNGVMHAIGGVCDNGQSSGGWGAHGGGAPANSEPFTAEVERFDPDAGEWVACPHMKAPVAYHACFAAGLAPLYD